MAWFFRVMEQGDGTWACRHGQTVFDAHEALSPALTHIAELARGSGPARIFLHSLDGDVQELEHL
ncbi:hypothetical protein SAMN04515671_2236 [Nakamurella panacisegetis]|uniref:DUF2188 domain-containing protein n=1 Tax=Nakamurella panacisegetis TaxID=1090615 RepID=A0A1H0N768_9ACTN|nr:hypothetical protein [Nakamurella panacisegetis]SDO88534.1 hypothetical protein SAMN04515671_2236 [Nakamurella panacisegetis]